MPKYTSNNQNNSPQLLSKTGSTMLEYSYDAAGTKLRQIEYNEGNVAKTTDFCANFIYINGKPAWNTFDEGRIVYNTTTGIAHAETDLKDHLGSTRVVYSVENGLLRLKQVNSYYPFGLNNKELTLNDGKT